MPVRVRPRAPKHIWSNKLPRHNLKNYLFKENDCLVDVRSPEEWKVFGKPDGEILGLSTYFVSYQLKENENIILNPNFIDDMNKLEFNKNTKIFLYVVVV